MLTSAPPAADRSSLPLLILGRTKLPILTLHADKSAHLDIIRSVAAMAVMWGHLRIMFFLDYPLLQHPGAFTKFIYAITGFGHQSVMIFFVLSGFFISSGIFRRKSVGEWCWPGYLTDRIVRLYLVLIPGLILGGLWDNAGRIFFQASGVYSQPLHNFSNLIVDQALSPLTFLGNALFLQTIFCKAFGSNGPLWSIVNEFWYYILFPALFLLVLRPRKPWVAAGYAALAAAVMYLIGVSRLYGFLIWLSGAVVVWAVPRHLLRSHSVRIGGVVCASALFSLCLLLSRANPQKTSSDFLVGLSFAGLLYGILQLDDTRLPSLYQALAHDFAGFSYSLYVLHFPLLLFLHTWISPQAKWQPNFDHFIFAVGLGICVMGYSWLIASATEMHTTQVRQWVIRHWIAPKTDER